MSRGAKGLSANVREVGEFVVNVATYSLREALNVSSAPAGSDVDEFELAGLTKEPSALVRPPRVAGIAAAPGMPRRRSNLAAGRLRWSGQLHGPGEVLGVHIRDDLLQDGLLKMDRLEPIARLGYQEYAVVRETFTMPRTTCVTVDGACKVR